MSPEQEFLNLLPALYASAAEPGLWPQFLEKLLDVTRAHTGMVLAFDEDSIPVLATQWGVDDKTQASYRDYFYSTDIIRERIAALAPAKEPWVCLRQDLVSDAELERNEFYNDYMHPQDMFHQIGTTMGETPGLSVGGLSLLRGRREGIFSPETVALLQQIAPHMRTAFLLDRKFRKLELQESVLEQVASADGIAFLAIDARRRVVLMSQAAEQILATVTGLAIVGNELRATDSEADSKLRMLIDGALAVAFIRKGGRPSAAHASGSIGISRGAGQLPMQVSVAPLVANRLLAPNAPLYRAAMVFLALPEAVVKPRGKTMREVFMLSPAEARLADCLLAGMTLRQASDILKVTESSARFMLNQIFHKTGTRSQSALMRLMLAIKA